MRKYLVALRPANSIEVEHPLSLIITADEVSVEALVDTGENPVLQYNFVAEPEEEAAHTVALVPFEQVRYVVIQP